MQCTYHVLIRVTNPGTPSIFQTDLEIFLIHCHSYLKAPGFDLWPLCAFQFGCSSVLVGPLSLCHSQKTCMCMRVLGRRKVNFWEQRGRHIYDVSLRVLQNEIRTNQTGLFMVWKTRDIEPTAESKTKHTNSSAKPPTPTTHTCTHTARLRVARETRQQQRQGNEGQM